MNRNDPYEVAYNFIHDVVYEIDGKDRLVYFNDAWVRFARANQAASLAEPRILQSSLWDYVLDRETRLIYAMLFDRVRTQWHPAAFSYRCDTPTQRRFMRMELQPYENGHIFLLSRVLHEEERSYTPLLDPTMVRSKEFVTICSWCKRVELPSGLWVEVEDAVEPLNLFGALLMPQLSHGICLDCVDIFRGRAKAGHAVVMH